MTLTLDDVRNMKFHMTRRSGYEVQAVDQFIDQVEEAFAQLTDENAMLKQQVEALKAGGSEGQPASPSAADQPDDGAATTKAERGGAEAVTAAAGERLVVTTSAEASQAAQRLVQMAEKVVGEAEQEAERIREDARREAHKITTDARARAERSESEARVNADRVTAEAKSRSEELDRDIASRRTEMFSQLESERSSLTESVSALRNFEAGYRRNLTAHLRSQIDAVEKGVFEPEDKPAGLPEPGTPSDNNEAATKDAQPQEASAGPATSTPRLDALLGDKG